MKQLERLSNGASKLEKIGRIANLAVKNISCYKASSWPGTEIKPVKACATDEYALKVGLATAKMQDDSSCGPFVLGSILHHTLSLSSCSFLPRLADCHGSGPATVIWVQLQASAIWPLGVNQQQGLYILHVRTMSKPTTGRLEFSVPNLSSRCE